MVSHHSTLTEHLFEATQNSLWLVLLFSFWSAFFHWQALEHPSGASQRLGFSLWRLGIIWCGWILFSICSGLFLGQMLCRGCRTRHRHGKLQKGQGLWQEARKQTFCNKQQWEKVQRSACLYKACLSVGIHETLHPSSPQSIFCIGISCDFSYVLQPSLIIYACCSHGQTVYIHLRWDLCFSTKPFV